jgi:NADP-dependent 3-hydroxy acid dehydrogenase YdfG
MSVSLQDQVAVVVGASSGMGRAIAKSLAQHGARVMAAARRTDRLDELITLVANDVTVETVLNRGLKRWD